MSETTGADNLVDVSRVQHVAITGVLVASYVMLLFDAVAAVEPWRIAFSATAAKSIFHSMPAVDATFVALLGVSHAALLGSKLYDKRMSKPSG